MRRLPLFLSAAVALGILFTLAVIKWNEGASNERLRVHIQQDVYEDLDLRGHLGARSIDVAITSTEWDAGQDQFKVEGTLTIPRKRFAVRNNGRWSSFQPSGEVRAKFVAWVSLGQDYLPFSTRFGPSRPVWQGARVTTLLPNGDFSVGGRGYLVPAWNDAPERLENALFDAHLSLEDEFDAYRKGLRRDAIDLIACRVLEGLGRIEEAATLASSINPLQLDEVLGIYAHEEIARLTSLKPIKKNPAP